MQNSDIEKCILMAATEHNSNLETFRNGCFSKTAAKIYLLTNSKLHIFYISYCDVMLKRNEFLYIFFLGKGFREKCEHTKIALSII